MKTKMNNTRTIFNLKSIGSTTRNILRMSLMVLALFIISCDGEDGMDGIDGIAGTAGTNGTDGAQGAAGENGNANVIASDWLDTDFDNQSTTFTDFDIEIPNLTRSEIDESAILVYLYDSFTIYSAPYVTRFRTFNYRLRSNSDDGYDLILTGQTMDGNAYTFDWMEEFRYVIIPQGVSASGKSAGIDYNKMSYEEVMDHLGLDY